MAQLPGRKANPKTKHIIDCTLEILRDQGDQGMSMRKVAGEAGMSLGNLQYYFKNKDELLVGLGHVYFERCAMDFSESLAARAPQGKRETIEFMVEYGLGYANNETGKVFRELWSIATRNERIQELMHEFYRRYVESLDEVFGPFAKTQDGVAKIAALLIPFFDGYGLVSYPLPLGEQDLSALLVEIVSSLLDGEGG